ncbi:hypothetical protein BCV69DRAFT_283492 [Microstroma glucosiphilum]|uniref:DNA polymerase V n=1 Tax=Pseudomicrostroma glucosiphilum TaxID=1684307 RepID=A0A316U3V3_9BASI|nr:hypothetical protein BCV69DRAFT_283492 [Pseudomicrostroma glucosiphilum]PWN19959.1 hypothetical protein BCV69DRAFT_283492 [Pseudomicrostroma glucosiphilum]
MASTAASSSALPLFWDLASAEEEKRLASSSHLVSGLVKQQSALASTSRWTLDPPEPAAATTNGSGAALAAVETVTEQQSLYVERKLDHTLASDVSYSLRRLVRGLASPREHSRVGFAVALTELLAHLTSINASDVLILIIKHSSPSGKVSRSEQRNLLFARLFGIQALVRSGMLIERPTTDLAEVEKVIELLRNLSEKKAYLRESCGWTLVQLLDSLAASSNEQLKSAVSQLVFNDAVSGDLTPEKVALILKLQEFAPKLKADGKVAGLKKGGDILSAPNLPTIAKVLCNTTPTEDKEDAAAATKAGDNSGSHNPRVHFIWDVILQNYFGPATSSVPASRAPFAELYRVCVDESLFAATASPERKSWGFQVFCKALIAAPAAEKPLLFTPNFMRTWINQLAGKERLLHNAATSAAEIVTEVVKETPRAGFALVAQLLGKHGSQNFDKLTKTKTIEGLLSAMDGQGVKDYIVWVVELLATSADDAKRRWALDQLLSLVRNTAIPTDESSTEDILKYLAAGGFFSWKKAPSAEAGLLSHQPKPSFSVEARDVCRSRFLSCLTELAERTTTVTTSIEAAKPRRVQGVTSAGELWVSKAWEIFNSLLKDTKNFASVMSEDATQIAADGSELLQKVRKAGKAQKSDRLQAFETLVVASLLFALESPEEAAELVESLNDCFSSLFLSKAAPPAPKSTEDGEEEREPAGIELLQDYIIGLLEKPSAFLRAIAEQVFGVFATEMTKESLDHLIDQLGLNEEPADEEEEGGDAMDVDGADGDEAESETSEDSIESASVEDDDEEDVDVDEKFRSDVLEALKAGGIAHEESDEDEDDEDGGSDDDDDKESVPDLTDDQMLAIDDKLAEIFRQRMSSRQNKKEAKQEAVAFRNKILDLLAIYARKQVSNPLVVNLVRPLFLLATESDELDRQVANKASTILRNNLCKAKEMPIGPGIEVVEEDLRAVHSFACRTASPELASVANTVNLYLTRVALGPTSNKAAPSAALVKVYEETLQDFLGRSACQLKASFLIDAFKRFPSLGWPLRSTLVESCSPMATVKTYRQQQGMQMLQSLVSQSAQAQETQKDVLVFMPDVANLVFTLLPTSTSSSPSSTGSLPNAAHLKEVLKFALQAVRITKRVVFAEDVEGKATKSVWKPSKIREAMAALEKEERFKNSTSLQSLLKQMLVIVEGKSEEGKKDKKRKAKEAVEVQGEVNGKGAVQTNGHSGNSKEDTKKSSSGGSKKKAKKAT